MLDLDAGKYAAYVWPAYGVTVFVILGMVVFTLRGAAHWRRRAEELRKDK